jgi:hypothetical protein
MASGHVNRTNRPNTWLHRPTCDVKKVLANSEPSTHGTTRSSLPLEIRSADWGIPDALDAGC